MWSEKQVFFFFWPLLLFSLSLSLVQFFLTCLCSRSLTSCNSLTAKIGCFKKKKKQQKTIDEWAAAIRYNAGVAQTSEETIREHRRLRKKLNIAFKKIDEQQALIEIQTLSRAEDEG